MPGENLIAVLILLPFAVGLLGLAVRDEKVRRPLVIAASLALMAASVALLFTVLGRGTVTFSPSEAWEMPITILDFAMLAYFLYIGITSRHVLVTALTLGQWVLFPLLKYSVLPAGYEVERVFRVDLLAVVMGLIISVVGSLIVIYALDYMREHEKHLKLSRTRQPVFFLFLIGLLGAMNGLVFANSILWLFFFWEITTLCCYHLIRHDLTSEAQASALRALWMNLVGAVACVLGMILVFRSAGTLALDEISAAGTVGPALLLPLALFCLTGFTKAAQVPWQSWLLGAMVAPTPVSALLHSSTMVKAGVYLVLRLAPSFEGTLLSAAVAVFGAFVFMTTALVAISQRVSKRVLAYSTISNLGLIICCAGINTDLAIAAAIALIIFHAVSKGMLFLAVGAIEQQIESRDIEDMEGLVSRLPLITGAAIVGMITMLFLPFGAVFAKWASMEAAAVPISPWFPLVVTFLAVGSAATLVFWSKWIGRLMSNLIVARKEEKAERRPFFAYGALLVLVSTAVVLSVFIVPLMSLLVMPAGQEMGYGVPFDTSGWQLRTALGTFSPWPLFAAVLVAIVLPALFIRVRRDELQPAYLCGENVAADPVSFRAVADVPVTAATGGVYWQRAFGENQLNNWINGAGILLLAALFAGVMM
ncbi:MAG: proton-conducting transporter membrane subunit [Thermoanaerobacterales bacterium]|nr:proton-conducting transporter membrane subunit [Bacillota bacterium]MDI6907199.1 proton-conducting transporter membrane subunit [Thermoanaerobacterales bacterium]